MVTIPKVKFNNEIIPAIHTPPHFFLLSVVVATKKKKKVMQQKTVICLVYNKPISSGQVLSYSIYS